MMSATLLRERRLSVFPHFQNTYPVRNISFPLDHCVNEVVKLPIRMCPVAPESWNNSVGHIVYHSQSLWRQNDSLSHPSRLFKFFFSLSFPPSARAKRLVLLTPWIFGFYFTTYAKIIQVSSNSVQKVTTKASKMSFCEQIWFGSFYRFMLRNDTKPSRLGFCH